LITKEDKGQIHGICMRKECEKVITAELLHVQTVLG